MKNRAGEQVWLEGSAEVYYSNRFCDVYRFDSDGVLAVGATQQTSIPTPRESPWRVRVGFIPTREAMRTDKLHRSLHRWRWLEQRIGGDTFVLRPRYGQSDWVTNWPTRPQVAPSTGRR